MVFFKSPWQPNNTGTFVCLVILNTSRRPNFNSDYKHVTAQIYRHYHLSKYNTKLEMSRNRFGMILTESQDSQK